MPRHTGPMTRARPAILARARQADRDRRRARRQAAARVRQARTAA